uniref:EF-hand domain-containing protein n=1 Tax=Macrostomum lignano TaxID=282301 RepID=A0A1I8GZL3_9PLAT
LKSSKPIRQLDSRLRHCQHRAEQLTGRIAETKEEIRRLTLFGNTVFVEEQLEPSRRQAAGGADFLREQSLLYQKLHPAIDLELNIDLVEEALQDINGHLITKKEMQYVYHILNLPARTRVNFRLFSVIAALSEKVVQLEPIIRKMVNKMNFDALDYKLEKCKEMFFLLDDLDDKAPTGSITVDSLAIELLAGNLKDENVGSVIKKFNREKRGYIDFLDYLTYVPLFLEIHERIVADPLKTEAAW